jgi:hypothetical protein
LVEHCEEPFAVAGTLDQIFLVRFEGRGGNLFDRLLATNVSATPIVRRCSEADPVDPGSECRTALEACELAVDHDEHLLTDIFDVPVRDTQVPEGSPYER